MFCYDGAGRVELVEYMPMTIKTGAMAMLLGVALTACSLQVDLDGLQYAGQGTGDVKSPDVVEDTVVPPDGKETTPQPDVQGPDQMVWPDTSESLHCFEVLECMLYEQNCYDFSNTNCINSCSDGLAWQGDAATQQLWSCLSTDCGSDGNNVLQCVWNRCPEKLLQCMVEKPGNHTCHDAVSCLRSEGCDGKSERDRLECMADCVEEMGSKHVSALTEIVSACSNDPLPALPGICLASYGKCFNASGAKTCPDLLDCALNCHCPAMAEPNCPEKMDCVVGCFDGVSDGDVIPLAAEVVDCTFHLDPPNAFRCLKSVVPCAFGTGGSDSCTQVMGKLSNVYYGPSTGMTPLFPDMVAIVSNFLSTEHQKLVDALSCLAAAAETSPFLGAIPATLWNTCAGKCN
jgi:hypothetical protein